MTVEEMRNELKEVRAKIDTATAEDMVGLIDRADELIAGIAEARAVEDEKKEKEARSQAAAMLTAGADLKPIEERGVSTMEVRAKDEYLIAYNDYIKTGGKDDAVLRKLLTTGVETGTVPVPVIVDEIVNNNWDSNEFLSHITKSEKKGVMKYTWEVSATDAAEHKEGAEAVAEEDLKLGVGQFADTMLKKWISVSDEAINMNGVIVDYLYDEITHKLNAGAVKLACQAVVKAATDSAEKAPSVSEITVTEPGATDWISAIGELAGGAENPVVVTSRKYAAAYKIKALEANYVQDPFDGLEVVTVDQAVLGDDIIGFVGDLSKIHMNFPGGIEPELIFDPYSMATEDLVRIIGKLQVGYAIVADKAFTRIKKQGD